MIEINLENGRDENPPPEYFEDHTGQSTITISASRGMRPVRLGMTPFVPKRRQRMHTEHSSTLDNDLKNRVCETSDCRVDKLRKLQHGFIRLVGSSNA